MESIIQLLSKIDIATLIPIAGMFWIFKCHLDKKFEKIDQRFEKIDHRFEKIDQRFEKVDERFQKIDDKINDIDKRVFSIETMLHMKDCCMLKDDRMKKKAE
jgi:septation ring formation regulator EzrA